MTRNHEESGQSEGIVTDTYIRVASAAGGQRRRAADDGPWLRCTPVPACARGGRSAPALPKFAGIPQRRTHLQPQDQISPDTPSSSSQNQIEGCPQTHSSPLQACTNKGPRAPENGPSQTLPGFIQPGVLRCYPPASPEAYTVHSRYSPLWHNQPVWEAAPSLASLHPVACTPQVIMAATSTIPRAEAIVRFAYDRG